MTLGAAALGLVGTGAFGYAAAMTYAGTTSTVNAIDPQAAGLGNGGVDPNTGTSGITSQPNQSSDQGGTVNPFFGSQQVVPPTTTRRHSHAITGGS